MITTLPSHLCHGAWISRGSRPEATSASSATWASTFGSGSNASSGHHHICEARRSRGPAAPGFVNPPPDAGPSMRAWVVDRPGPVELGSVVGRARPVPEPGAHELRVRVATAGVCRTDLHLACGELEAPYAGAIPGHEIVGVDHLRPVPIGSRSATASASHGWPVRGRLRVLPPRRRDLCSITGLTGWTATAGYAEYATAHEDFVYRLPDAYDDLHVRAAPVLRDHRISGIAAVAAAPSRKARHLRLRRVGAHHRADRFTERAQVHVFPRTIESRVLRSTSVAIPPRPSPTDRRSPSTAPSSSRRSARSCRR